MKLTVLAGPNGVGKTYYSGFFHKHGIISVKPINTDSLSQLVNDDFLPSDILRYETEKERQIKKVFYNEVNEAIQEKRDFSYECNYSYQEQIDPIGLFDGAGYELELIYMCLSVIEESIQRVRKRRSEGGHNVVLSKLRYNFLEGLKNLDKSYESWNHMMIVETDVATGKLFTAMTLNFGNISHYNRTPNCFSPDLTPRLLKLIKEHKENGTSKTI